VRTYPVCLDRSASSASSSLVPPVIESTEKVGGCAVEFQDSDHAMVNVFGDFLRERITERSPKLPHKMRSDS